MKTCNKCHQTLPLTEFYKASKQSRNRGGVMYACKKCHSKMCTKRYREKRALLRDLLAKERAAKVLACYAPEPELPPIAPSEPVVEPPFTIVEYLDLIAA